MLVSVMKRGPSAEDFLEPLVKRCRLGWTEDWLSDSASFAAQFEAADDRRRCLQMDDLQEPALKRLRGMEALSGLGSSSGSEPTADAVDAEKTQAVWAEALVRSLQGCPSVDEAIQRCSSTLLDFEAEVRQAALREAELREAAAAAAEHRPHEPQNLQHTNRVLMRAVHHLAERCRRLEANGGEAERLRRELEMEKENQRRLLHSNQVLQEHLKVHLNGCYSA